MSNVKDSIHWADYTWNPITGCLRGCNYCYARKMAHRFKRSFEPTLHPERLDEPAKLRKPSKIFVCSVSDLLGAGVKTGWIHDVIEAINAAPWHTYQILTKDPFRLQCLLKGYTPHITSWPVWLGATATDQASWDMACGELSKLPTSVVRWISAEPMLAHIWPHGWMPDWVVIGGLSGHGKKAAASSAEHGRVLEDHLSLLKVPVFEKDSLGRDKPVHGWPS